MKKFIRDFAKGINWEARLKSKTFWVTVIPAFFLVLQAFLAIFGVNFDYTELVSRIVHFVNVLFGLLAICGIAIDHTTTGISDGGEDD